MNTLTFKQRIQPFVQQEIQAAEKAYKAGEMETAFHYLERAHVLGQAVTSFHTRVHWLMFKIGWSRKNWKEVFGQGFRIVGASTFASSPVRQAVS